MGIFRCNRYAAAATITVMVVNTETFTNAANSTSITMIGLSSFRIIVEHTDPAEILCKENVTTAASFGYRLVFITTDNTSDLFSCMAVNLVIFGFIMTSATRIVPSTALCFNPTVALIMGTTTSSSYAREDALSGGGFCPASGFLSAFCEELMNTFGATGV